MNPEFRRQLWLNFSPARLAVLPMLLLACFAAVFLSAKSDPAQALAVTGTVLFFILVLGMGTFAAGASVMDEITDRTWDLQRMSAMQPWAMTWGKLAGSTAYGWYGGGLCLLVAVPAALVGQAHIPVLSVTLAALLAGLCLQAMVVAINLQLVKVGGRLARRAALWAPMLVLLWGLGPLLSVVQGDDVRWWQQTFTKFNFIIASLLLFTVCALGAAWRSMAEVLAVRQLPWGWPTLALLTTTYLSGFAPSDKLLSFALAGLATSAVFTYFALFSEPQHRPMWQRVIHRVENAQWRAALLQLPRWPATLLLALCFALLLTASLPPDTPLPWNLAKRITFHPIALVLLMMRDCALALFVSFSPKNRRFGLSFSVLMLVLYALLPWLLSAASAQWLLSMAQPLYASGGWSVLLGSIHLIIALGLLHWRWRAVAA